MESEIPEVMTMALDVMNIADTYRVDLISIWTRRTDSYLLKADAGSKVADTDNWAIPADVFESIKKFWGPFIIDWFASEFNRKTERFYSKCLSEKSLGVDAFVQNWPGEWALICLLYTSPSPRDRG